MGGRKRKDDPDIVIILSEIEDGRRVIVETIIVGSANPCRRRLDVGDRLARARRCLEDAGFVREFQEEFGDFVVSVFVRNS